MRRHLLVLLLIPFLVGAAPSRQAPYTAGTIISPTDVTSNEDVVFAYLQAGVDTYKTGSVESAAILDGTITNADISSSAAITLTKLASLPGIKGGTFTRDTSTASGNQTVSGVGFTPIFVIFVMGNTAGQIGEASVGLDNGTTAVDILDNYNITANQWQMNSNASIDTVESFGTAYSGKVASFTSDGFVVSWTRSGTPTGTITVGYMAFQ